MLNDIHDRLTEASERLRSKQKLDSLLRETQGILRKEQRSCSLHEQTLAREQADVDKLEGLSLTGLFYSILGTKEDRLETERQEYLAAKLKHEESSQAVLDAQEEVEILSTELASYSDAERVYNRLFEEKEQLLTQTGDHRAESLMNLTERLAELATDRKELLGAVEAGKTAQRSLEHVRSQLRSAENWGTWDMLGGGTVSTWIKHSKIDSAKRQAQVAQRHLRQFQKELADTDQRLNVSLGAIGGFSTFADYFFDGLIADWVVQSKVRNASAACNSAIRNLTSALNECRRSLAEIERGIKQIESERRQLIETA